MPAARAAPPQEHEMHTGSCLCSAIKYEINGELGFAYYCHCSRCRKESGPAFEIHDQLPRHLALP
jgi:hypothetical protein